MENKVEFSSNNWDGNYAGGDEGLIDIRGIHRIYFYNESFHNNGENTMQVYQALKLHDTFSLYSDRDDGE